jgi:hypothetical protein
VTVEVPRWKSWLATPVLLAASLGSAAGAVFTSSYRRLEFAVLAVALGYVFLVGLSNLWRKGGGRVITVTDFGIEHPRVGLVRWDEIEKVAPFVLAGQPALGVWTHDFFLVARRGPAWMWPFLVFNFLNGYPPLSFTRSLVPIEELYAAIETRRNPTSTRPLEHVRFDANEWPTSEGGTLRGTHTRT